MSILAGVRDLIGRPIRHKFRAAVHAYPGDQLLVALLGKALSQPGLAPRVFGEGEVFLIKGGLFLSGVRLDKSAHDGVGEVWKEDLGQLHYNPDAGSSSAAPCRMPFIFLTASTCLSTFIPRRPLSCAGRGAS